MKSFLFENIWILSHKDRRARQISFHPKKNLIVGRNHTGKSSLIKTLFVTLGAHPQGDLAQWDDNAVSLVDFRVGQDRFRVLHQRGYRALFDVEGKLIAATGSHSEWSESFSTATGFNLVLTDKHQETVPADARCFFIPFYINQDGSWQAGWDTFTGMQQYRAPIGAILEYFTGIKPPEYYEVKSKRDQEHKLLDELRKEQRFLEKAKERFGKSLPLSGPKVHPENFDLEIEQLTKEVTSLNQRQEALRDTAVRQKELRENLKIQIRLANDALETYGNDAKFLRTSPREKLVCPTCRAEHSESFLEIFTYAENARVLHDLVIRLQEDLLEAAKQYLKTQSELQQLESNYNRITEILDTRRGDLQFQQVVDSMGAESAFRAFEDEGAILKNDIDQRLSKIEVLDARLKALTNKKRSKTILDKFRDAYEATLMRLNLPSLDTSRLKLTSRPDLSGSGGPRSVLAYYGAIWQVCYGAEASFTVPLVIDSPNQQGQDDINLPKVLKYLSTNLPPQAQVIVGSEMDTDHEFDNKLVLDEPYKVLKESEYSTVEQLLEPLRKVMYDAIQHADS